MFNLYQGHETAAYRQAELLEEIAADRLARSAAASNQSSDGDRTSPVTRLIAIVADALSAVRGTHDAAGRRPRWT